MPTNAPDKNWLPTLRRIERFYGFLPSEISGVWTCRVCGTVARENESCKYCHDIDRFPLKVLVGLAKAAWLDREEELNLHRLLPLQMRLRIYYETLEGKLKCSNLFRATDLASCRHRLTTTT